MKAAIFDFDGTLFDSAPYWCRVINNFLAERQIEVSGNILSVVKPLGISDAVKLMKETYHLEEPQQEIVTSWRSQMGVNYHTVIPLRPCAREYIGQLRREGIPVCLATAMERDFVMPALERTGILPSFDLVVTIADVKANKKSPRIYEYCAEKYQLKPGDCTVFEDSVEAAGICRAAGFEVIGVFDGVCTEDEELMKPYASRYIHSFRELLGDG